MKSCQLRNCIAGFLRYLFAPCIALSLFLGFGLIAAPSAQAQLSTLNTFTNTNGDGAFPTAGLIMDSAGNLYGTTSEGGTGKCSTGLGSSGGCGTVFELVYSSGTYTKNILYSFTGIGDGDGAFPTAGLIMDSAGNLYGTTSSGGTYNLGTVFELVYTSVNIGGGEGFGYTERVLYSFTGTGGDGSTPNAGLVMDSGGNLYGTTEIGGIGECLTEDGTLVGCGTVFELEYRSPQGLPGYGIERVLHNFTGTDGDGATPNAGLIMDSKFDLYGTTEGGGAGGCLGSTPLGSMATVIQVGLVGCGTVFELYPSGVQFGQLQPNYSENVLHSFNGGLLGDGALPSAGLIMDSTGNLYGTTSAGGVNFSGTNIGGTAFELIYSDGTYTQRVLHSFTGVNGDGALPTAGLIMDSAGNLYGTTSAGGSSAAICTSQASGACGTVFELVYPSYLEGVLHSFTYTDGQIPAAGLIIDSAGNLYGTTELGGTDKACPMTSSGSSFCAGTVFKLAKSANPPSGPSCSGVFAGIHGGPIVVLPSTVCEVSDGEIDGNVEMSGGTLVLSNTVVTGNVQVTGASTFSMSLSTVIRGNLQVQNSSPSTALDVVCGAAIGGNLQFLDNATGIDLGSLTVCPGNTIGGSLQVQNNSGAAQILDITVNGNLQVQNNTGSTQINGNTVSGNLQVQNNTGSTQVFSNTVTSNLQCENNTSIKSGGNTAGQKQGQCSTF